ncbi:THAP domain-containing protein 1-like isoform X1 [Ostrinia nubilalis]|uniref:THAP domain-containing protein 1-like isoform X1 n=2 Tax=Ostrinia nubilalis TaxID=29057 RepID=UPI0030824B69
MVNKMSYSYKSKENVEFGETKGKATPVAMVAPEVKHNADVKAEITKTCAVLGCEDSKNLDEESFFRFPEDANLKQIWTDLTGRNNWTPTDYSYICIQHFSVDCFKCDASNEMVLVENAVPSLKLPRHVLEVEYIDEETLDNEEEEEEYDEDYMDFEELDDEELRPVNGNSHADTHGKPVKTEKPDNTELLKLFTEVQKMQRQAVGLRDKLKRSMRAHNRQNKLLHRIQDMIERKKKILDQKRKKKARILLSLQDKINEDMSGLVLAMPIRQTDDLKNFALSIYKYSPQAYIYVRNSLRTMLPSTEVLDSWLSAGYQPRTALSSTNLVKLTAEQTEKELSCKIMIG